MPLAISWLPYLGVRRFSNVQGGDPYLSIPNLDDFEIPGGKIPRASPSSWAFLAVIDAIISLLWFCLFLILTGCCCMIFARPVCCSSQQSFFYYACLTKNKWWAACGNVAWESWRSKKGLDSVLRILHEFPFNCLPSSCALWFESHCLHFCDWTFYLKR